MAIVARIIGLSLLTSALGAGIGLVLFGRAPYSDSIIIGLLLACVGAIVGALAGTAREIANAFGRKDFSGPAQE